MLIKQYGIQFPFLFEGIIYILLALLLIVHRPVKPKTEEACPQSSQHQIAKLRAHLGQTCVLAFMALIVFYQFKPNFQLYYNYYQTEYLKMTSESLGVLFMVDAVCFSCGYFVYSSHYGNANQKKLFIIASSFSFIVTCSY